jgi:hypothetical protein|tara:strand:+ start:244 stop:408 length:165 start_codon:yes stop_codon:yes gene_type:complete
MTALQALQLPARYKITLVKRMSLFSDKVIHALFDLPNLAYYYTFIVGVIGVSLV